MKVTVVGAGNVGATCAQRIVEGDIADVYLVDVVEGLAEGKALDLAQAAPIVGHSRRITGGQDYEGAAGSDVVVITAGKPRQPGMSREDLLAVNAKIVASIAREVFAVAPDAIFVVVTNPLDVTTHVVQRVTGLPRTRVMGMAGLLDTARFRTFVAWRLGCSAEDVSAMVLGGHGDTMVPILSHATLSGVPLTQLLSAEELEAIVQRTRDGGAEVVRLLKTGSAYYAPAAAVAEMVAAIAADEKRLAPVSVELQGEYGLKDVCLGVPVILGAGGAERVVEVALPDHELEALHRSARAVAEAVEAWHRMAGDDPAAW
ncbi:MAG: malate dehydrogenase [Armatimonadetes bacterium]|nr:malate dehydrogenase [Armatimonadota bacterium]